MELDGSRLGWRLRRYWDCSRLGRRKDGGSRLRSMTRLEIEIETRLQNPEDTTDGIGVSQLGRRKLSGPRLGRREVNA